MDFLALLCYLFQPKLINPPTLFQSTPFQQSARKLGEGEPEAYIPALQRALQSWVGTWPTARSPLRSVQRCRFLIPNSKCFQVFQHSINPSGFRTPFSSSVTVRLVGQHNFCWNIIGRPPDMRSPTSSSGQLKNVELLKRLIKNEANWRFFPLMSFKWIGNRSTVWLILFGSSCWGPSFKSRKICNISIKNQQTFSKSSSKFFFFATSVQKLWFFWPHFSVLTFQILFQNSSE